MLFKGISNFDGLNVTDLSDSSTGEEQYLTFCENIKFIRGKYWTQLPIQCTHTFKKGSIQFLGHRGACIFKVVSSNDLKVLLQPITLTTANYYSVKDT